MANGAQQAIAIGGLRFICASDKGAFALIGERFASAVSLTTLRRHAASAASAVSAGAAYGRGAVAEFEAAGERLVLRRYRRGGMVRHLLDDSFLHGPLRSLRETRPVLELLAHALLRQAKVNVPEPAAVLVRRTGLGLAYEGAILTVLLPETDNFLSLAKTREPQKLTEVAEAAGREARRMLDAGIMHRDLHLGNVLVDRDGRPWLIDFDRCRFVGRLPVVEQQRAALAERWRRSAEKHGVDSALTHAFVSGLSIRSEAQ